MEIRGGQQTEIGKKKEALADSAKGAKNDIIFFCE
jgi:hypothetical protein